MPTLDEETKRLLDALRKAAESIERRGNMEREASNLIDESSRKVGESLNKVVESFKKLQAVVDETIVKFNVMKNSKPLDAALSSKQWPNTLNQNPMTLKQNVTFTRSEMDAQNAHGVESV